MPPCWETALVMVPSAQCPVPSPTKTVGSSLSGRAPSLHPSKRTPCSPCLPALRRRDHVEVRKSGLTEVERVLLRALAIIDPDHQQARRLAADAIAQQSAWLEQLKAVMAAEE